MRTDLLACCDTNGDADASQQSADSVTGLRSQTQINGEGGHRRANR